MPLRGVFNGCATAGTAVAMAARAIETGEHDLTIAIGMDKHPRGAFAADPSVAGLPAWYGQTGLYLTTHFFGMKINRYMHDHGITARRRWPGWRPRTSATRPATRRRGGAPRCRWRRSSPPRC